MKNVKSRIRMHVTDEHLKGCMPITTETKHDVEPFLKEK
jgi:hypothetical protein